MEVIAISGFANSGKSTVAEFLSREYGFMRISFAAALKDIVSITFGWDRARLEGKNAIDRHWREEPDPFWSERLGYPITPRYALQFIGTNVFRTYVHENIWVDMVIAKIHSLHAQNPNIKIVIDDVRFLNERQTLRSIGAKFLTIDRTHPDEQTNSEHNAVWRRAFNPSSLRVYSTLHPSEWEWLCDPLIRQDTIIANTGSYDDLYAAVRSWYTIDKPSYNEERESYGTVYAN